MAFSYEHEGLQQVADFFEDLAEDVKEARDWVSNKTDLDFGQGLLNYIVDGHSSVRTTVLEHMEGFKSAVLEPAAEEFREADNLYKVTDDDASKEIDSAWTEVDADSARDGVEARFDAAGKPFQIVTRAKDFKQDLGDFSDEFKNEPEWTWNFSILGQGRTIFYKGTELATEAGHLDGPIDPYEYVLKPVFGDWTGLRECAEVYDILYKHYEEYASKLAEAGDALDDIWTGTAADQAKAWIYRLSKYCTAVADDLEELAKQYKDAAQECYALAQAVGPPFIETVEHAIIAYMTASAGIGADATLVGIPAGVVLHLVTAGEVIAIGKKASDVMSALGILQSTIGSHSAAIGSMGIVNPANLRLGGGMDTETPDLVDEHSAELVTET